MGLAFASRAIVRFVRNGTIWKQFARHVCRHSKTIYYIWMQQGGKSNGGGDAGDESRPRPAWELLTTVPLSSHQVDINYSVADEQFIGVIIVYHRFTRRAEIFQKFRPIDHYIATRYSISLTMLEPLRELSAAQFPSFLLHELIVEQGMFKLYYVSIFVSRYWQIFKKRVNECAPCTGILEIIVCQFVFCIDRWGDTVNRRNWNLKISSRFHL